MCNLPLALEHQGQAACPEQRDGRDVTCADCTLCHKRGKRVVIAFPAHGTRKATADQLLKELNK